MIVKATGCRAQPLTAALFTVVLYLASGRAFFRGRHKFRTGISQSLKRWRR